MKKLALIVVSLFFLSASTVLAQVDFCEHDRNFSGSVDGVDFNNPDTGFLQEWLRKDCPPDGPAPVEKTGQTYCYIWDDPNWIYAVGTSCDDTGQDGEHQKGVEWPNPRFTINIDLNGDGDCNDDGETCDGTVTDNLTGLIWHRNPDCWESDIAWTTAITLCDYLEDGYSSCGLYDESSPGDWRLPNRFELESLLHLGYFNPSVSNTLGTGKATYGDPFNTYMNQQFWSSTTVASEPEKVWVVYGYNGRVHYINRSSGLFGDSVICVRGGRGTSTTTTIEAGEDCTAGQCGELYCCCNCTVPEVQQCFEEDICDMLPACSCID